MEMEREISDAKVRSRRRRSIRNLREGLPTPQDDCYGSTWLEAEEPVRKRKKRRSSLFVGLPALQSSPLREEGIGLLDSSLHQKQTEEYEIQDSSLHQKQTEEYEIQDSSLHQKQTKEYEIQDSILHQKQTEEYERQCEHEEENDSVSQDDRHDFLTDIEDSHAANYKSDTVTNTESVKPHTIEAEKCINPFQPINAVLNVETESNVESESKQQSNDDEYCVQFEDNQEWLESVSSGSNVTSPTNSVSALSPCSMSPDYLPSPSYISHFVDQGESFLESSDGLQTQSTVAVPLVARNKNGLNVSPKVNLNLSDKENEALQSLNITPTDVLDLNKSSPGFLSLCKNIAGKVVNFVKTSPSYLTGAMFDSSLNNSKASHGVLQENLSVLNNGDSSISSQVEGMHISNIHIEDSNVSYTATKNEIQASVDTTLEEMEAEIEAEIARSPKPATNDPKTFANLQKPVFNFDIENSSKNVESSSKAYVKSRSFSSSGSAKKKRDMTMFLQTFNAISNVYKNDQKDGGRTDDSVFSDSDGQQDVQGSRVRDPTEASLFTDEISFPPPQAPDRRKSKSSSVSDFDFLDQLMNTETNGGHSVNMPASHNTSRQSAQETGSTDTEPVYSSSQTSHHEIGLVSGHDSMVTSRHENETSSQHDTQMMTNDSPIPSPTLDQANKLMESLDQHRQVPENIQPLEYEESSAFKVKTDNMLEMIASSENPEGDSLVASGPSQGDSGEPTNILSDMCTETEVQHREEENLQTLSSLMVESDKSLQVSDSKPIDNTSVGKDENTAHLHQTVEVFNKRKRKYSAKISSEKTIATEMKDVSQVSSDSKVSKAVGRKKTTVKSVIPKRRSGQFKDVNKVIPNTQEENLEKCSVSKKKKIASPLSDDLENNTTVFGDKTSENELTANIEEKISKLALLVKKQKGPRKSDIGVKKQRRRSGRLPKLVDLENKETAEQGLTDSSVDKNNEMSVSAVTECSSLGDYLSDSAQVVEPIAATLTAVTVKKRGRGRRSSDFKDIPATVTSTSAEITMDVTKLTDEISQVNLSETKTGSTSQLETGSITNDNVELPDDNVVQPKRRRRRSADAATLKIQLVCEMDNKSDSPNSGPVTTLKGSRKRKLDTPLSEEELEKLYRNKNFTKPEERRPWQTIHESPPNSDDTYGKKKLQRYIEFEKPSQMKLRRRLQKAIKNGWDPRKMRKKELQDDFVENKLAAMRESLDDSTDSLVDSLKSIIETS